jgi:hypothetical protein
MLRGLWGEHRGEEGQPPGKERRLEAHRNGGRFRRRSSVGAVVVDGSRWAPVVSVELRWVLQHEGRMGSEVGAHREGGEAAVAALTLVWGTAVQRPTWTRGHRRGTRGDALLVGVEVVKRGGERRQLGSVPFKAVRQEGAEERGRYGGGATHRELGRGPARRLGSDGRLTRPEAGGHEQK